MPLQWNVEQLLKKAIKAHNEIYDDLGALKPIVSKETECEELADIAVCLREAEKYLEDLRKEITGFKTTVERLACVNYLEDATRVMKGKPISTEYVTASPDMKVCAKIPTFEKDNENYQKLMTYLGIDPILWDNGKVLTELGEEETEVVKVNWLGFTSLLTRLKAAGLPLPDGIDPEATYTLFSLRMRKKGALVSLEETNSVAANVPKNPIPEDEIPF